MPVMVLVRTVLHAHWTLEPHSELNRFRNRVVAAGEGKGGVWGGGGGGWRGGGEVGMRGEGFDQKRSVALRPICHPSREYSSVAVVRPCRSCVERLDRFAC